jgi:hypothetical protein
MDVTGAEALRRRIEQQAALDHESERQTGAATEPVTPPRDVSRKGWRRSGSDVRPVLKSWIEPGGRPVVDDPAPEAVDDPTPNGGGAGALSRRLAERRSRYSTVSARKPQQHAAAALEPPEPAFVASEPAVVALAPSAPESEPSELALEDPEVSPVIAPAPVPEPTAQLVAVAPVPTRAALGPPRLLIDTRPSRTLPHLPTVAFSVGLSLAAALAAAVVVAHRVPGTSAPAVTVVRQVASASPAAPAVPTRLRALDSYNPYGTGPEHSELAPRATDGDLTTYWSTETYADGGFQKPGTGLVFASAGAVKLGSLEVDSDTPGFQAQIRVSDSPAGGFTADSGWQTVKSSSIFDLQGKTGRYWMIWLRLPTHTGVAHINEIRALP